jgi:hypothetical protein
VTVAIGVLILWFITAAAGGTVLRAGGSARRRLAEAELRNQPAASVPVRIGAIPLTPEGKPPPVPHVRVATPPGEHPLLEFMHPALGVTGLAFWAMFTFVHYRPLAWISFGILLVTLSIGLSWQGLNRVAARRQSGAAWAFPPRLLLLHGVAAGSSILLTVLTALVASRG